MKIRSSKLLSLLLCLAIALCLLPAAAFADGAVPHFTTYTVLGDSNPSGFGLDAYYENAGGMRLKDGDLIEGSYPAIVAEAITADNVNVYSHCAWRANELLRVIDPDFDWDDGYSGIYYTGLGFDNTFGFDTDSFAAKIPAAIRAADIITMQFGSNDIFTHSVNRTTNAYPDLLELPELDLQSMDANAVLGLLFAAAEKLGILGDVVVSFESFMNENVQIFKANMSRAIARVHEMNPDAQIYVVGTLNSLDVTCQSDNGLFLSIPSFTDARICEVNLYLSQVCAGVDNCVFVDVPNTDMFGVGVIDIEETFDDDIPYTALKVVHPTSKGHAYMAEQIITAICDNTLPAPVITVSSSSILKKNVIRWGKLDGAVMYRVYRSTSVDGKYSYIGSTALNVFYDGLSASGTAYYYKVCAVLSYTEGTVTPLSKAAAA